MTAVGLMGGYIGKHLSFLSCSHEITRLSLQAWPPEGRCVRDVMEPGALRMQTGDPVTIIEGR